MIFSSVLREWDELPEEMKSESVRKYYDILYKKRYSLLVKRLFDLVVSLLVLLVLLPVFLIIAIAIKIDSNGPIIFRQIRVTQYGRKFNIMKFRTMVVDAERIGTKCTVKDDERITKIGKVLRKYRLDELPQLLNIISGDMSFVGTRPEVIEYVEKYTEEMMATLLLPAGVTSEASIKYKDENLILHNCEDSEKIYTEIILPRKMYYNLKSIQKYSFLNEIKIMFQTVKAMLRLGKK